MASMVAPIISSYVGNGDQTAFPSDVTDFKNIFDVISPNFSCRLLVSIKTPSLTVNPFVLTVSFERSSIIVFKPILVLNSVCSVSLNPANNSAFAKNSFIPPVKIQDIKKLFKFTT